MRYCHVHTCMIPIRYSFTRKAVLQVMHGAMVCSCLKFGLLANHHMLVWMLIRYAQSIRSSSGHVWDLIYLVALDN